jgi:hypothetical protein
VNFLTKRLLICITAHNEGALLSDCYSSFQKSLRFLPPDCVTTVQIALDCADTVTTEVAYGLGLECFELKFRDVGLVRNWFLETGASKADYICFVDGDDLISEDFFMNAIQVANQASAGPAIISPSTRIHFWSSSRLIAFTFRQPSTTRTTIPLWRFLSRFTHLWGSAVLLNRAASDLLRFRAERDGFVFEDWWFSYDAINLGIPHLTARGAQYYRQRHSSRRLRQSRMVSGGEQHPGKGIGLFRRGIAFLVLVTQWRPFAPRVLVSSAGT